METYDLDRFVKAQNEEYFGYQTALEEMKRGRKQSHWIWYIFPQLKKLGRSPRALYYGLESLDEAKAYLAHPVLGARLLEITNALLSLKENDPYKVMNGETDALKLLSCMTLFSVASGGNSVFDEVLDKFFFGKKDENSLL